MFTFLTPVVIPPSSPEKQKRLFFRSPFRMIP